MWNKIRIAGYEKLEEYYLLYFDVITFNILFGDVPAFNLLLSNNEIHVVE